MKKIENSVNDAKRLEIFILHRKETLKIVGILFSVVPFTIFLSYGYL